MSIRRPYRAIGMLLISVLVASVMALACDNADPTTAPPVPGPTTPGTAVKSTQPPTEPAAPDRPATEGVTLRFTLAQNPPSPTPNITGVDSVADLHAAAAHASWTDAGANSRFGRQSVRPTALELRRRAGRIFLTDSRGRGRVRRHRKPHECVRCHQRSTPVAIPN